MPQKPDLVNQRRVLEEFIIAKGLANVEFVEEIAGAVIARAGNGSRLDDHCALLFFETLWIEKLPKEIK